jgi:hypothetical protein
MLGAVLAAVAVVSWSVLSLLDSRGAALLPALPWSAPGALAVLAVLIALAALGVRRRLRERFAPRRPGGGAGQDRPRARAVNFLVVARLAALGKASAYGGAVLAGVYAGYLLLLVGDLTTDLRRTLGAIAGLSAVAAAGLAAAGLALERSCKVPPDADDSGPGGPPSQVRPS